MINTITLQLKFIHFELRSSNVPFVSEAALYIFPSSHPNKIQPPPPPPHTHTHIIIIIIIIIITIIIILRLFFTYALAYRGKGSFGSLSF